MKIGMIRNELNRIELNANILYCYSMLCMYNRTRTDKICIPVGRIHTI